MKKIILAVFIGILNMLLFINPIYGIENNNKNDIINANEQDDKLYEESNIDNEKNYFNYNLENKIEELNNYEIVENKDNSSDVNTIQENRNSIQKIDVDTEKSDLELYDFSFTPHGSVIDVEISYFCSKSIQFRWLQYDCNGENWSELTTWQSNNYIKWQPKKAGDFWIYVEAKDVDGVVKTKVCGYRVKDVFLSIKGICLLNKDGYFDAGVAYDTDDVDLQFQWKVYDLKNKKWEKISNWYKGNWVTWRPDHSGDYWLHAEVITGFGRIYSYTIGVHYEAISIKLNGICSIERKGIIDIGVSYSTNGTNTLFQWKVYDLKNKKWEKISNWYEGNWATWKPTHSGDYWLYVEAKTSNGTIVSYVCGYHVQKAKIVSYETNIESPQWVHKRIVLNGKYEDYYNEVATEKYLIYDGSYWHELLGNEWIPEKVGEYLLCYEILNYDNEILEQRFIGFSIENPFVEINNIDVYNKGNLIVSITADVDTNDRNIEYKWMYYDITSNKWGNIKEWSNSKEVEWHANKEGAYWIYLQVRINNGLEKDFTIGYYLQKYSDQLQGMINKANNYSSSTPYIAIVDRNAHKVSIMNGKQGHWVPIKYWDCANGKASTPTVSGIFKIQNRGYYFDSGNSRCFWWTQFYGNYLFHSILCNKDGSIQDGRVGMALSHGCVRLEIENAKWIYDNLPRDTTVVIY